MGIGILLQPCSRCGRQTHDDFNFNASQVVFSVFCRLVNTQAQHNNSMFKFRETVAGVYYLVPGLATWLAPEAETHNKNER